MPYYKCKTPQLERILKLSVTSRNDKEIEIQAHTEVQGYAGESKVTVAVGNRVGTFDLKQSNTAEERLMHQEHADRTQGNTYVSPEESYKLETPKESTTAKCANCLAPEKCTNRRGATSTAKRNGHVARKTEGIFFTDLNDDTLYSPERPNLYIEATNFANTRLKPPPAADTRQNLKANNSESILLKQITSAVSSFDQITVLNLTDCQLKRIPDDIHVLQLRELNVCNNLLNEIPHCLYLGLSQLKCLNLSSNNLSEFEHAPACITTLKTLNLAKNKLPHPPVWILQEESVLSELYHNSNPLDDLKKETRVNQSLNRLEMRNCLFFNIDLHYLRTFRKLEHLDLGNTEQSNRNHFDKLEYVFNMLNLQMYLQVLQLLGLGIPELPNTVGRLSNLRELDLSFNHLSKLPGSFVELSRLQVLKLTNNQLFELPADFNRLGELRTLEAQFNFISSVDLRGMHYLKHVDLYHNDLSDAYVGESVELIDLDCNYVHGVEVCRDYARKRDLMRATGLIYSCRLSGYNCDEDYSDSSASGRSLECDCILTTGNVVVPEDEDWNVRSNFEEESNGVTLSDSEYQGEDLSEQRRTPVTSTEIDSFYDYLYEDAD